MDMFNKKRIVVFVVFFLFMFCFITFAGGTPQNQAIATRNVVFIDSYNNEEISAQKVIVGEDAIVPVDPEHNALIFVGWYLENDHDIRVTDFTSITENITVVALYGQDINNNGILDDLDQTYTVTFVDTFDGTTIGTSQVLVGMDATAPAIPTHDGLTFAGWDRGYTNITGNITVNTVWNTDNEEDEATQVNQYTVTFIDGIDGKTIATVTVDEGLTAQTPTAPKHNGYIHIGWDGNYTSVTSDEIVTAEYAVDANNNGERDDLEQRYIVSYYGGLENVKGEAPRSDRSYLEKETYTVLENTFTLEKAVFLGWSTEPVTKVVTSMEEEKALTIIKPGSTLEISENVQYYAVWAIDENENGTKDYDTKEVYYKIAFLVDDDYMLEGTLYEYEVLEGLVFKEAIPSVEVKVLNDDQLVFDKWQMTDPDKNLTLEDVKDMVIRNNMTFEAVFAKDENNNEVRDDDPTEIYHTVRFITDDSYAHLMGDDTSNLYEISVLDGTTIGDKLPSIKVDATDNLSFEKWTVAHGTNLADYTSEQIKDMVVTSDLEIKAIFGKDNNNNNIVDDKEDHYTLTIEYLNTKGNAMFDTKEVSLVSGETFKQTAPVPDKDLYGEYIITPSEISHTMKAENATITVLYTPKNGDKNDNGIDDSVEKYTLTILYEMEDKSEVLEKEEYEIVFDTDYRFVAPEKNGYVADPKVVEGTMPQENKTVTVTYLIDENNNGIADKEDKFMVTMNVAGGTSTPKEAEVLYKNGTEFILEINEGYTIDHASVTCDHAKAEFTNDLLKVIVSEVEDTTTCQVTYEEDKNNDGIADRYTRKIYVEYPNDAIGTMTIDTYKKSEGSIIDTEVFDKKVMTYETREATYTFSHWVLNNKVIKDEEIKAGIVVEDKDMTFKAVYTETLKQKYTVNFYNEDKLYKSIEVIQNEDAIAPATNPSKASTAEFDYRFIKWEGNLKNVTEDRDIYATYESIKRKYTVTFYDFYENEIVEAKVENVEYGKTVNIPTVPIDVTDNDLTYRFIDWKTKDDKEFDATTIVTGNLEVYAKYRWVQTSTTTLYVLPENYIRQENGGADDREFTEYKVNGKTVQITFKDDEDGTLADVMKKANKKGEYPLASGTNVRNYLTEDSLKDLEEAGINVDFYVLKLCVNEKGILLTRLEKAWHLDAQVNSKDLAVYRNGEFGLKIVSKTNTITKVERYDEEWNFQKARYESVLKDTISDISKEGNEYLALGFSKKITSANNSNKYFLVYYIDKDGNEKTEKYYWEK